MAIEVANFIQAACVITQSANGVNPPVYAWSVGFNVASALNTHSAAGVYALVLDDPLNSANGAIFVTQNGTSIDSTFDVVHTSDTVKTITTRAAGVAADTIGFAVLVCRQPTK